MKKSPDDRCQCLHERRAHGSRNECLVHWSDPEKACKCKRFRLLKTYLCTPANVGILAERGESLRRICFRVGESESIVTRYLRQWRKATDYDRKIARTGASVR